MNAGLRQLANQFLGIWNGLSRLQKALFLGAGGAVFAFLVSLALRAGDAEFRPLFTDLRPEDAGEIIALLKERGVPYQLSDGGQTVSVPAGAVYETRLDLASQGLPRGGVVGFEILQDSPIGATEFERKLRYYWALQGELSRTIQEIEAVRNARVHIAIPEKSLFIDDAKEPTASVLVELKPGYAITKTQVRGIANLLARSVEGLKPENVTILDTKGNLLSEFAASVDGLSGHAVMDRLEVQRAYERELGRSLQAMLERVYGSGQVVVGVRAELNFDLQEKTREVYEPVNGSSGIIRSEQHTSESWQGEGTAPGGVAGVFSNIPGYVAEGATTGTGEYERTESTVNYEINRLQERRVVAPGSLDRLSVAVWISGSLDDAERQRVAEMVTAALGLQPSRGDQVSVSSIPFDAPPTAETTGPLQPSAVPAWWQQPALWVGVAAAVGLLLLAWRWRRRQPVTAPSVDVVVGDEEAPPVETPAEAERRRRLEDLERIAKQQPKEFARLLKTWLVEE